MPSNYETAQTVALVNAAINLHILRCNEHDPDTGKCDFFVSIQEFALENASKSRAIRKWSMKVEKLCEKYELTPLELAQSLDEIAVAIGAIHRGNKSAASAVLEALTAPVSKIGSKD